MNRTAVFALLAANLVESFASTIIRVTISYRVLELGLSSAWLGAVTAVYAVLPAVIALQAGRYIDRGHDARVGWIGGAALLVGALIIAQFRGLPALFIGAALTGVAGLLVAISAQTMVARFAAPGKLDSLLGTYLVVGVIGQALGPVFIGWIGGSAKIPPTDFLFNVGVVVSAVALIGLLMLRPSREEAHRAKSATPMPIREILRMPGMPAAIIVGVVAVSAQDLIVVYLPLIGVERGMPVSDVGLLLAIRSVASMAIRVAYAPLNRAFGSSLLLKIATFSSAVGYFGLALPLPFMALAVVMAALGAMLGLSMTLSIGRAIAIPPVNARGTANSLRMMGNRAGMVVVPSLMGLLAAAAGIAAIFVAVGASLAAVWAVVQVTEKRPKEK